jgi:hypothetical protein
MGSQVWIGLMHLSEALERVIHEDIAHAFYGVCLALRAGAG